jgi:alpha-tubulin suppressor-like RCC1 family protein
VGNRSNPVQILNNNTINVLSPILITTSPVSAITTGYNTTHLLYPNGNLESLGYNAYGQLGLGNTTNYSSPMQVGALTSWLTVSAGYQHSAAIKTNGTLWSFGRNNAGQLGLGNGTNVSSPAQVGSLTNWSNVAAGYKTNCLAIKTDGTMWSWGSNGAGQLGLGNAGQTNYSSPTQIGALTTWSSIGAGQTWCLAGKTDGTLWTWGSNYRGALGLNDGISYRSSPAQVGALTNWLTVAAGYRHALAIKTNGTLWSWGKNNIGALGQSDTTDKSAPTQVGALTNWLNISAGNSSLAISS